MTSFKVFIALFSPLLLISCTHLSSQDKSIYACHFRYGGDWKHFEFSETPYYEAKIFDANYFFRAKVEIVTPPTGEKLLKVYSYAEAHGRDQLIHQAVYNVSKAPLNENITGEQTVYEPATEAEMKYWCEVR
ncbi:hypothetical protein [Bdellovibrio sp.]|uniref:hypothetical protein n=1 Tax=Bdellovibrio sp. TaxID=28201 RepID=UPI0039E5442C